MHIKQKWLKDLFSTYLSCKQMDVLDTLCYMLVLWFQGSLTNTCFLQSVRSNYRTVDNSNANERDMLTS